MGSQSATSTATFSLQLTKELRSRAEEEDVASQLILNAVAEAFALRDRITLPLADGENVISTRTEAPAAWQSLLLGKSRAIYFAPGEASDVDTLDLPAHTAHVRALFPGAFRPIHDGHLEMAKVASQVLETPIHFEISIENVDKPLLDYAEMRKRADQFAVRSLPLWFTRAPTFEEKSRLFPGATFVVGADTIERIGDPRYYGKNEQAMEAAVQQIAQRGCRFLVFGRLCGDRFQSLADLNVPNSLRKLADEVPADRFRRDISSTEIRKHAAAE